MSKHFNTTDSEIKEKTICVPAFSFALVFSTAYVVGYSFQQGSFLLLVHAKAAFLQQQPLLLILMILAYSSLQNAI